MARKYKVGQNALRGFAPKYQTDCVIGSGSIRHEEIQGLNPHFSGQTTAPVSSQNVYVPAGAAEQTLAALEWIPVDKRLKWRAHEVQAGEDVNQIATAYNVSADTLRDVNNLSGDNVDAGTVLVVPTTQRS